MGPAGSSGPVRSREAWVLAGICAVGLLIRAACLVAWAHTPLLSSPTGDELNFHQTALGLLGLAPEPEAFLYQPLYAFFLATVYAVLGPDPVAVRGIQLVLGLVTICLFYGLGHRLAGRWSGRLAAGLAAVYGPLIFFEGQLLAPGLVVMLVAGGLWCLLAAPGRKWLLLPAGLLFGLALMARPNLVFVLPVFGIWWLFRVRSWRGRLAGAGFALAGLVIGLAPSWIHNAVKGQGVLPVSSAGGLSFYLGNNPQASGRFRVPRGMKIDASSHAAYRRSWHLLAEQAEGRRLSPAQVSNHWFGRGLRWWAQQPGAAAIMLGKKLLLAVNAEEAPIHHPYGAVAEVVWPLAWLPGFGLVFAFGLAGLWLGRRRTPGVGLLGWTVGVYLAGMAAFYVADRYRLVSVAMLIPLAAVGLVGLRERVRAGGLRATWPGLLVVLAAFGLTQLPFSDAAREQKARYALQNLMGSLAAEASDTDAARAYFERAIQIAGDEHGSTARANLGLLRERRGDLDGALELYRRAAVLDDENRQVRVQAARLCEQLGRLGEAIAWWRQLAALSADPAPARAEIARLRALVEGAGDDGAEDAGPKKISPSGSPGDR